MTDRPVIFSKPMVCALLDGSKTMTRRLAWRHADVNDNHTRLPTPWQRVQVGDRLWVRENIKLVSQGPGDQVGIIYAADANPDVKFFSPGKHNLQRIGITPCIHMPRWASRITLTATAVKIEPVQSISDDDAIAEGIHLPSAHSVFTHDRSLLPTPFKGRTPAEGFANLWCAINGRESWDSNPEVVAVTFKVRKKGIGAVKVAA